VLSTSGRHARVWDLPTRIFHLLLVLAVAAAEEGDMITCLSSQ
jgi:cytochrome b